ncbi:3-oxoadipate enol-lactone hydrolase [Halobacteriales archaeon QS_8_69_26]|nr:MAG: 3-oxoadipate enol-lactone hydrolase [Halobacteriales archaeon QS_8_69_26]
MPRARNGEVSLYYEVSEPADGDGETVVFVEGQGYGRWMWNWQVERMDGYERVVWDNRGTGDSDAPGPHWLLRKIPNWKGLQALAIFKLDGYRIPDMAADLEAVLDDAGVEEVHVVGASLGGMVAQEYAVEYDRAKSVTLLCTSMGGAAEPAVDIPEETIQQMYAVPEDADERGTIKHRMRAAMTDEFFESNPETVEEIVDWRLAMDAGEAERLAQGAAYNAYDSSGKLDRLTQPTLVAHGTADRVLPVENGRKIHERLPNSDLELYEGGEHLFFIEEADAVTERIREHVREHA